MTIRKKLYVIVGTAFFLAGFYLFSEAQWVYAAISFLIGFWYFIQSVRKAGVGKGYKMDGSDDEDHVNDDNFAGDSFDSDGGSGGDD
jgi:hypothetical protein